MKKLFPLFITLVFSSITVTSQTKQERIEALLYKLSLAAEDTNKLELYNNIFSTYFAVNSPDALQIEQDAVVLAEKLDASPDNAIAKAAQKKTVSLDQTLGRIHWKIGNFEKALQYHFEGLEIAKKLGDDHQVAATTICIGQDYADQGNYPDALKYFNLALKMWKDLGDMDGEGGCYSLFAFVYAMMGNTAEAVKANYNALKIYELLGDKTATAVARANLADSYVRMKKYDEALKYYQQSVEVLKTNDKVNSSSIYTTMGTVYTYMGKPDEAKANFLIALKIGKEINCSSCMGQAYEKIAEQFQMQGEIDSTLANYFAAEELYRSVSNNSQLASVCNKIGTIYLRENKLAKAKEYFDKAFVLSNESDNLPILQDYYKGVQSLDSARSDWKNAYFNFNQYITYRDSLNNEANTKSNMQTVMQYEFDKKEAAAKADQEKKDISQRNFRNSMIGGAGFLFILLIVLYNRYRFKQKANNALHIAYENLKTTQQQLIVAERKATFGEMATRMAHEILNPLNFVNNFSSINSELVEEIENAGDEAERNETIRMLKQNIKKTSEHGQRASVIVKQLQDYTAQGTIHEFFEEGKFSAG